MSNIFTKINDWRNKQIRSQNESMKAFIDRGYMNQEHYDKYEAGKNTTKQTATTGENMTQSEYDNIVTKRNELAEKTARDAVISGQQRIADRKAITAQHLIDTENIKNGNGWSKVDGNNFVFEKDKPTTKSLDEYLNKSSKLETTKSIPASILKTHTIVSGDTLSAIAKKYQTTVNNLMESNTGIDDANKIYVGQKIVIPGANTYSQETIPTTTSTPMVDPAISQEYKVQSSITETGNSNVTSTENIAQNIINKSTPYVYNERLELAPGDEILFQDWWKETARINGLNIDADSPDQDYDYRKLWAIETTRDPTVDPLTKLSVDYAARQIDVDKVADDALNNNLTDYSKDALMNMVRALNERKENEAAAKVEKDLATADIVVQELIDRDQYPETFTPQAVAIYEDIKDKPITLGDKQTYDNLLLKEQSGEILSEEKKAIFEALKLKLKL